MQALHLLCIQLLLVSGAAPEHLRRLTKCSEECFTHSLAVNKTGFHGYSVDVSGAIPAAQYVHDYVESGGLLMPSKRRAYRRDAKGRAIETELLVSIDLSNVSYT